MKPPICKSLVISHYPYWCEFIQKKYFLMYLYLGRVLSNWNPCCLFWPVYPGGWGLALPSACSQSILLSAQWMIIESRRYIHNPKNTGMECWTLSIQKTEGLLYMTYYDISNNFSTCQNYFPTFQLSIQFFKLTK